MTNQEILDFPVVFEDTDATSIREYFHALLETLWLEGEGFSGKRPFGNSGWEYDLYTALVHSGAINGIFYEDGGLKEFDKDEANNIIIELIAECFSKESKSANSIQQVFLKTKQIFAKQVETAAQEALDKIYTEYFPHVENDTMSNVYFQTYAWLERFFAGMLREDDIKIDLGIDTWNAKAARQKIYEANKEEIQAAIGRDLQDKIDSLKASGRFDSCYSPYQ